MKELKLQCLYKKGDLNQIASLLRNPNVTRLKNKVINFDKVQNIPSPQEFYKKDFNFS